MCEKKAIVVVLGYGCHLTEKMKRYLDFVILFVEKNPVSAIITTGGFTNRKSAPGISEAGMMAKYLKKRGVTTAIMLEETATTTNENILGVANIIFDLYATKGRIVIFCDEARSWKVKVISRFVFGFWPKIITYDLTNNFLAKIKQIIIATPLDILALRFEFLAKMEHRRRENIMNNS